MVTRMYKFVKADLMAEVALVPCKGQCRSTTQGASCMCQGVTMVMCTVSNSGWNIESMPFGSYIAVTGKATLPGGTTACVDVSQVILMLVTPARA